MKNDERDRVYEIESIICGLVFLGLIVLIFWELWA